MSLTCVIIGSALWFSTPEGYLFQPASILKLPESDVVAIRPIDRAVYLDYEITSQHQLRMDTEEWVSDCVYAGYTLNPDDQIGGESSVFIPFDDIDVNERTGVDDQ